jgi:hypothetical protein
MHGLLLKLTPMPLTLVMKDLLSSIEGSLAIFNWIVEWTRLDGAKAIEEPKRVAITAD